MDKTITISRSVWMKLTKMKYQLMAKNLNDVISKLIRISTKIKRGNEK